MPQQNGVETHLIINEIAPVRGRMINEESLMIVVVAFTIAFNLTRRDWPNGHVSSTNFGGIVFDKTAAGFFVV